MNTEELKQKALKCYGWRNASSAWLHESGDGSAVVGNIDDSHDPAIRNPVAVVDVTQYDGFQDDSIELAQFYAAANPATILALIAERDELTAKLDRAQAEIRALESNLLDAATKPIRICEACATYPCKCE
jgi:hypothetical protein